MIAIISARPISVSDTSVSLGLDCIDTSTIWIGDISEAPTRWYVDITTNDDDLVCLYWVKNCLRKFETFDYIVVTGYRLR